MTKKTFFLLVSLLITFYSNLGAQDRYKRHFTIKAAPRQTGVESVYDFDINGEILSTEIEPQDSARWFHVYEIKNEKLYLYQFSEIRDSIPGLSVIIVPVNEFLLTVDHPSSYNLTEETDTYGVSLHSDNGDVFDETLFLADPDGRYYYEGGNRQIMQLRFRSSEIWLHVLDEAEKATGKK